MPSNTERLLYDLFARKAKLGREQLRKQGKTSELPIRYTLLLALIGTNTPDDLIAAIALNHGLVRGYAGSWDIPADERTGLIALYSQTIRKNPPIENPITVSVVTVIPRSVIGGRGGKVQPARDADGNPVGHTTNSGLLEENEW